MVDYCPDAGDIVWLQFSPTHGHEQSDRRPALVLTPKKYNERTGLMLVCPITSRAKGYSFEVALPKLQLIQGVVLADQVRSLSWNDLGAEPIERAEESVLAEVKNLIATLLSLD